MIKSFYHHTNSITTITIQPIFIIIIAIKGREGEIESKGEEASSTEEKRKKDSIAGRDKQINSLFVLLVRWFRDRIRQGMGCL